MNIKKDLPLTSSHWGTYRAKVKDGKVEELIGWENDNDPSPIGPGIVDVHNHHTRIDSPMIRKSWRDKGPGSNNNLRGTEPFIAISCCLLYTSPSPRDSRRSRMPSSA